MACFTIQLLPVAVLVLCAGTNCFVTTPSTTIWEQTDTSLNHDSEIFGKKDAEQLSELSVIDVLFKKRSSEDCDEAQDRSYKSTFLSEDSPIGGEEVPVEGEASPAGGEESPSEVEEISAGRDEVPVVGEESPTHEEGALAGREEATVSENDPAVEAKELLAGEESPAGAEEPQISVEEVELISYEDIANGEQNEDGQQSNHQVVDYLTPPAEGARCNNYEKSLSTDKTTSETGHAGESSEDQEDTL